MEELGQHGLKDEPIADCDCNRCALAARDALRAFAQAVMRNVLPDCCLEGYELQELGEKHGLLVKTEHTVPCGENCACAEWLDDGDISECFRATPLLTGHNAELSGERSEST